MVVQLHELMKKWAVMYWRSPAYNLTRFLMTTLIALFYGTMYLQKGHLPASGTPPAFTCNTLARVASLGATISMSMKWPQPNVVCTAALDASRRSMCRSNDHCLALRWKMLLTVLHCSLKLFCGGPCTHSVLCGHSECCLHSGTVSQS